jgi:esterase/lipase
MVHQWEKEGFTTHIYDVHWYDERDFEFKLNDLLKQIDMLHQQGVKVSIIGTSAGGSMALNVFYARKEAISRVVNICGRLRAGKGVYPSLEQAAKKSKSFEESVRRCESGESLLGTQDRERILTMRALYDEVVPTSTSVINGAENRQVLSIEHMLTIGLCMTVFSQSIFDFLKK